MGEQNKQDENPIISTRSTLEFKRTLKEEAELRAHTRSQALDEIIKLGWPRYLKKFPRKFERVETTSA